MESAIPGHLTVERTRHRRVPDDYAPSFPAFVARNRGGVDQVVMAYLGLQFRGDRPVAVRAALDGLDAAFAASDGPGHHDRATHTDGAGYTEIVTIAYWDDPAVFDRWFDTNREGWIGDGCRAEGIGRWIEAIRPRVEEFETLFSVPERVEGIAALSEGWSDEIQEHAYWGGMRDRLPLSQTDAMLGGGAPEVSRDGSRIRVRPREGLCLIRSGQDWTATEGEDRAMYLDGVEPDLRAGMEFLRDDGRPIGCYANRYLHVLENGEPVDRSFGMSWWRSLDALERWAESHPTHVAIFGSAMKYMMAQGTSAKLALYHEVSVVSPDEHYFEYLDCHPATGLLGTAEPAPRMGVPASA